MAINLYLIMFDTEVAAGQNAEHQRIKGFGQVHAVLGNGLIGAPVVLPENPRRVLGRLKCPVVRIRPVVPSAAVGIRGQGHTEAAGILVRQGLPLLIYGHVLRFDNELRHAVGWQHLVIEDDGFNVLVAFRESDCPVPVDRDFVLCLVAEIIVGHGFRQHRYFYAFGIAFVDTWIQAEQAKIIGLSMNFNALGADLPWEGIGQMGLFIGGTQFTVGTIGIIQGEVIGILLSLRS